MNQLPPTQGINQLPGNPVPNQLAGAQGRPTGVITIETAFRGFAGFAGSRIGGRPENQDTIAYNDTPLGLLVLVCDGMGGGPGGKTASVIAATTIGDYMAAIEGPKDPEVALNEAINAANLAIIRYANTNPGLRGMGSTVVALLINDECAYAAHIGDSRIYQLRGHSVVYRSTDHSKVMELVRLKQLNEEQARLSADSNIITQALGHGTKMEPEIVRLPYLKGDRFALCSDGIWGMFPQKELIRLFTSSGSPAGAVDATVIETDDTGKRNGNHHDNLTLAIVDTLQNSKLKVPMTKTVKIIIAALAAVAFISIILNIVLLITRPDTSVAPPDNAEQTIAAQQKQITDLKTQLDAAKKANDKAMQKADQAKNEAEQAREQSEKLKDDMSDIVSRLEKVEKNVNTIYTTKDSKVKQQIVNQAVAELEAIKVRVKDKGVREKIDKSIEELNKKATLAQNDRGEGQVKAIAQMISDAAKSLKK